MKPKNYTWVSITSQTESLSDKQGSWEILYDRYFDQEVPLSHDLKYFHSFFLWQKLVKGTLVKN